MSAPFVNLIAADKYSWEELVSTLHQRNRFYVPSMVDETINDHSGMPMLYACESFQAHIYPPAFRPQIDILKVQLKGAEDRAMLILEAKELWMKRALDAENKLQEVLTNMMLARSKE